MKNAGVRYLSDGCGRICLFFAFCRVVRVPDHRGMLYCHAGAHLSGKRLALGQGGVNSIKKVENENSRNGSHGNDSNDSGRMCKPKNR